MNLKNIVRTRLKKIISYSQEGDFRKESFSQFGEDLILQILTQEIRHGCFIDVGAYHPIKYSNTYLLYKSGWRGINIEPRPGSKKLFDQFRSQDQNLEFGISKSGGEMDYFIFKEGLQNTFKLDFTKKPDPVLNPRQAIEKIYTWPLANVVRKYNYMISEFSILLIDTEGSDLDVLESNDWDIFKPQLILVEDLSFSFDTVDKSNIWKFISRIGYELIYHGLTSSIYRRLS